MTAPSTSSLEGSQRLLQVEPGGERPGAMPELGKLPEGSAEAPRMVTLEPGRSRLPFRSSCLPNKAATIAPPLCYSQLMKYPKT